MKVHVCRYLLFALAISVSNSAIAQVVNEVSFGRDPTANGPLTRISDDAVVESFCGSDDLTRRVEGQPSKETRIERRLLRSRLLSAALLGDSSRYALHDARRLADPTAGARRDSSMECRAYGIQPSSRSPAERGALTTGSRSKSIGLESSRCEA